MPQTIPATLMGVKTYKPRLSDRAATDWPRVPQTIPAIPTDLQPEPRALQLQRIADELWSAATEGHDPAPSFFVRLVERLVISDRVPRA